MIGDSAQKLIEAYFKGGNAQGKNDYEIGSILQVIIDVVEKGKYEERKTEKGKVLASPPNPDPYA